MVITNNNKSLRATMITNIKTVVWEDLLLVLPINNKCNNNNTMKNNKWDLLEVSDLDLLLCKEILYLIKLSWMILIGIKKAKKVSPKTLINMKKEMSFNLKMEPDIRVNGKTTLDMEKESKYGLMVPNMKACGKTTKLMDKALSGMFMETDMKESGREIKLTVTENTLIVMAQLMKVTGRMISNMVKV